MKKKLVAKLAALAALLGSCILIIVFVAVMGEVLGSLGANSSNVSGTGVQNEQFSKLSSLTRYSITGIKEEDKYILSFSFSGWSIENLEIKDSGENQSFIVYVPSLSGTSEEKVYSFLVRKGFTPQGASGVIANVFFGLRKSEDEYFERLDRVLSNNEYADIIASIKYENSARSAAEKYRLEITSPGEIDGTAQVLGIEAEKYYQELKDKNIYENDGISFDETVLRFFLQKEDGRVYFDGTLGDIPIAGSFKDEDQVLGKGTLGEGAYSKGNPFVSPFGDQKFWITSLALAYRVDPVSGETGDLHQGWDLAFGGDGTPIYSVADGKVVFTGDGGGFGNHLVVIQSGDLFIYYGHMCEMDVSTGDDVLAGQKIGAQGSEGYVTGSHLHLEMRVGNMYGEATANLDVMEPILMEYAYNYSTMSLEFNSIIR